MRKAKIRRISIRFFDNREIRAVWDDANSKWWFSVPDIIEVPTDQNNYKKSQLLESQDKTQKRK